MGRPSPTPPPPAREPGPSSAESLGAACSGLMLPRACVTEASPSPVGLSARHPRAPAGALAKSSVHCLLPSLQTVHLGPNPGSATTCPAPPEAGFLPGKVDVVTHTASGDAPPSCAARGWQALHRCTVPAVLIQWGTRPNCPPQCLVLLS